MLQRMLRIRAALLARRAFRHCRSCEARVDARPARWHCQAASWTKRSSSQPTWRGKAIDADSFSSSCRGRYVAAGAAGGACSTAPAPTFCGWRRAFAPPRPRSKEIPFYRYGRCRSGRHGAPRGHRHNPPWCRARGGTTPASLTSLVEAPHGKAPAPGAAHRRAIRLLAGRRRVHQRMQRIPGPSARMQGDARPFRHASPSCRWEQARGRSRRG